MECLGQDGGVPGVPGGMGMLLPFRTLCTDAGREPLVFCFHHLVFHSTRSALGSVIAGCQGLPRDLLKLLVSLTFFAGKPSWPSFLDRVTNK